MVTHATQKLSSLCTTARIMTSTTSAPLHPWAWPSKPWSRLHLDFAGPFLDKIPHAIQSGWMLLSYYRSPLHVLSTQDTHDGLPQKAVTDNGPSFISHEYQDFLSQNSIVGITSAPYHLSTNGLAERTVQSLKAGLKKTSGATILPIQNYTTHNHWCTTS